MTYPTDATTRIRMAGREDAATILSLIRELAAYEDLLDQVRASETDILRDGFGDTPRFECLLAEQGGGAVGFALFFHSYSTFEGRSCLYLEDLYVNERTRSLGLGRALMARLANLALARGCARLELAVLDWNPARAFYRRLGFDHNTDWLPYRLAGVRLEALAAEDGG
ncbi:MAG: GNAT family N-acetyltransferase [Alphaproteobacteria bacterium]